MQSGGGEPGDRLFSCLLSAASRLYAAAVKLRGASYDQGIIQARKLPCRVISVGNITAGGTGKTPMTLYMAGLIRQMGYRTAVLSRGYKGEAEKKGVVVSDGRSIFADSRTAGDEPLLMACRLEGVPVLVGGNRYKSGMLAVTEFYPEVVILDDGFQHRRLHRDLDLLLIDAKHGMGSGYLIPRGKLREPASGLSRADAVVLTRSAKITKEPQILSYQPDIPVFRADHVPYVAGVFSGREHTALGVSLLGESLDFAFLKEHRVFAFSGIAQNTEFRDMLEDRIGGLAGFSSFGDHYFYSDSDLESIVSNAQKCSADLLATTEKDFVRIAGRLPGPLPMAVIGVRIAFIEKKEEEKFTDFVRHKLGGAMES